LQSYLRASNSSDAPYVGCMCPPIVAGPQLQLQRTGGQSWRLDQLRGSSATGAMCFESFIFFFSFCYFFGPLPRHMEVPRLGVESELWPPAYARATAMRDPSRVCDLHHSSWQRRIVNPLSKGRVRTRNLMVPSRIR